MMVNAGKTSLCSHYPGTAASHVRGQMCIDFVTSESGSALIGHVHLQSSKLIAQGHGSSRRAAGTGPA